MSERTHDYTVRGWGHDFVIHEVRDGGRRLRLSGWGNGLHEGDYLIIPNHDHGGSTRYRLTDIRYHRDPPDMWAASATFAPRVLSTEPLASVTREG